MDKESSRAKCSNHVCSATWPTSHVQPRPTNGWKHRAPDRKSHTPTKPGGREPPPAGRMGGTPV
eukprot:337625-Alexandrium_andersonii.AAC.1